MEVSQDRRSTVIKSRSERLAIAAFDGGVRFSAHLHDQYCDYTGYNMTRIAAGPGA
jgi:hypothetical protein